MLKDHKVSTKNLSPFIRSYTPKPHIRHRISTYSMNEPVTRGRIHRPVKIPIRQVGDERVMNEPLRPLARPARRSDASLDILAPDGPHTVRGELSAISCFEPGTAAVLQDVMSSGRPRYETSADGGKQTYPPRIACQTLTVRPFGPGRCQELTPKTTESHWSGGQREP